MIGRSCGSWSTPLVTTLQLQRRDRQRDQQAAGEHRPTGPGARMTRAGDAVQKRDCARRAAPAADAAGSRPFSTRSPSQDSIAGSTVSEANTAMATTRIAPSANEMNVLSPLMNMPAIATITVTPEISTARPDVAAAVSSAPRSLAPGGALLALAPQVEQRVVDADREPDQQDDRRQVGVDRAGSRSGARPGRARRSRR